MYRDSKLLEKRIGYSFKNKKYLTLALTHSSYSNEESPKGAALRCNERLEFLGDSVLSLIVSTYLFETFPGLHEGELSKIRATTVCEKALAEYASELELGLYLRMGHGEDNNESRNRPSITSDAFEALIAAIYLDSSYEEAKEFVLPFAVKKISTIEATHRVNDYKSELKQIVERESGALLEYILLSETGPAHDRTFRIEARLNNNIIGVGTGKSKREAEQNAAKEALTLFGEKP
ncbi:MAG: ribonuclease III [Eubacteriales bacterium]